MSALSQDVKNKSSVERLQRNQIAILLIVIYFLFLAGCNRALPAEQNHVLDTSTARLPSFVDVTNEAGLGAFRHETGAFGAEWFPETNGSGGGFIDYNDDGWWDIVLVGGGTWPGHNYRPIPAAELYRNNGDGTFTRVTEETGLSAVDSYGQGVAVGDYDNDGDQDFFITTIYENLLFRNEGGVFTEVGKTAGVADHAAWSTSAIFFDADRDGWLDLYVGNYVNWARDNDLFCTMDGKNKSYCTPEAYQGVLPRYYHNNGDGSFTEMSEKAGFWPSPGKTLGVAELDFNGDNWPDLVVANDTERNLLYQNNGDGTFKEIGIASGVAFDETGTARAGMGIDAGDVDNSGKVSIVIGHFANEMIGVYRYMGNGLFVDRSAASKVGNASLMTLTFGILLFDADLDGFLDLFLANGHIAHEVESLQDGITYRQLPQLFANNHDGTFSEIKQGLGPAFEQRMVARGTAYADYDRDGDLDILLTESMGPAHLFRNDLKRAKSLRVRLHGTRSNRDGVGASIEAVSQGQRMTRRIRSGRSYLSQSELVATFGLKEGAQVDTLIVSWPSGQIDRFVDIKGGQEICIEEAAGSFETCPRAVKDVLLTVQ